MADVNIDTVNAAITELVNNPEVDYKIGNKTVKAGQKITQLLQLRKQLMENPAADISLIVFDALDINEFGTDTTQYVS